MSTSSLGGELLGIGGGELLGTGGGEPLGTGGGEPLGERGGSLLGGGGGSSTAVVTRSITCWETSGCLEVRAGDLVGPLSSGEGGILGLLTELESEDVVMAIEVVYRQKQQNAIEDTKVHKTHLTKFAAITVLNTITYPCN